MISGLTRSDKMPWNVFVFFIYFNLDCICMALNHIQRHLGAIAQINPTSRPVGCDSGLEKCKPREDQESSVYNFAWGVKRERRRAGGEEGEKEENKGKPEWQVDQSELHS